MAQRRGLLQRENPTKGPTETLKIFKLPNYIGIIMQSIQAHNLKSFFHISPPRHPFRGLKQTFQALFVGVSENSRL